MISTINGVKELSVFTKFETDRNLPKHKKENTDNKLIVNQSWNNTEGLPTAWLNISDNNDGWVNAMGSSDKKSLIIKKIKNWLISKLQGTKQIKPKQNLISVIDFFTQMTKSFKELTPIAEIAEHYQKALIQAKVMGQTALYQKLEDALDMVRGEAHLIAMGLKQYVTEKQVIDFYDKVGEDKHLKLTWVKNFNRIIPEDIYLIKKDVDEREIFDNYVILHYDPLNNGESLTKEEIEKKKDPILFGVMKNSRKLYYVADWKDEYCELTLEEMFKSLKGKVLQINNKSVKTFIDKTTI